MAKAKPSGLSEATRPVTSKNEQGATLFVLFYLLAPCAVALAADKELLNGVVTVAKDDSIEFSLSAESREKVVGGVLQLGESVYDITHLSVHRLVGARKSAGDSVDFAVFSSSYSAETATGQPWVASGRYVSCDKQYNSFLAIYSVKKDKARLLPDPPYRDLTESIEYSDSSVVYCFISEPGRP